MDLIRPLKMEWVNARNTRHGDVIVDPERDPHRVMTAHAPITGRDGTQPGGREYADRLGDAGDQQTPDNYDRQLEQAARRAKHQTTDKDRGPDR